uniref:Uncharacterized protein n=1 Tax=Tanacetum cinerariifolium TaxID=118510 RepID=A0A6L2L7P7_TANCI|nr:hypothetical protein [Tanacetum cinerariifolium]
MNNLRGSNYQQVKLALSFSILLDISTEMIGNSGDKILMLAVVDTVHGIGHVPSVYFIDYLRIHSSVSLIYCAYAFFIDVRILARQPQLDCGCSHAVCVPFNFMESGRTTESKNWSPQQPPQWAHFRHIHFGFMANHEAAVDAANEISMRQQKCMDYLVRAYYGISSTRYYKDDSCWSADLKSKTTEDIISNRSFIEVFVLNHYVLVKKVLLEADHVGIRGHSDGDAICLFGTTDTWVKHMGTIFNINDAVNSLEGTVAFKGVVGRLKRRRVVVEWWNVVVKDGGLICKKTTQDHDVKVEKINDGFDLPKILRVRMCRLTQLSSTIGDVFARNDLPRVAINLVKTRHCLTTVREVALEDIMMIVYFSGVSLEVGGEDCGFDLNEKDVVPKGVSLEVGGEDCGFDLNEKDVVPKVDDISLVDGVFDGAFSGEGEDDIVMGEGVVVTSSSLEMLTYGCLGGIMVSLIFLEGLEEKA